MKRTFISVVLATKAASPSSPAMAQKKPTKPAAATKTEGGGYEKVKTYDFSADTIEGDLVKPDGEFVNVRTGAEHSSLIKIRDNFIKEIVKSAEDL